MASSADRKVIAYIADVSDIKSKLRQLEALNKRFGGKLGTDLSKGLKQVGTTLGSISTKDARAGLDNLANTSTKTSDTFKKLDGSLIKVTKTTKVNSKGVAQVTNSYKNLDKNTVSLGQNISRLAKRAALTIPLWLALRGAVMGTISTFRDGISNIALMDKALQKARRNMQGTPKEIAINFDKLKKSALELSLKTGVAVEDIVTSFQRFATTGQDFETSMAGATASTKLAIAEFGDTKKTADALAKVYKVLGDSIDDVTDKNIKLETVTALIDELWKTNAFDIGEMGKSLERFASTAKITDVSLEDTIKLMATLHSGALVGQRGGRLLGSSMLRLASDLGKVQKVLKIDVNPEVDNMSSVLIKVVDALVKVRNTGGFEGIAESSEALRELFNLRGQIPIATLVSLRDVLKENFAVTPDVKKFNKEVNDTAETTGILADRFKNVSKEAGKAFVTGVVGGEDFNTSLKTMVTTLEENLDSFRNFGSGVSLIFQGLTLQWGKMWTNFYDDADKEINSVQDKMLDFSNKIVKGMRGGMSESQLTKFIESIPKTVAKLKKESGGAFKFDDKEFAKTVGALRFQLNKQISLGIDEGMSELDFNIKNLEKKQEKSQKSITEHIRNNAEFLAIEKQERNELNALGLSELDIEKRILQYRIETQLYTNKEIDLQKELIRSLERIEEIELKRIRLEGLIRNQTEALKIQGATNLQLLQAERILENMYGINQDKNSQLQYELNLERELTKEKLMQNDLSSDSMKLYEIAKTKGRDVAYNISKFLKGGISVEAFEGGGKFSNLRATLEKYFQSELTQRQASRFFFEGRGKGIPIGERTAMEGFRPIPATAIKLPKIETNIATVKLELKQALSKEQLSQQILSGLADALENDTVVKESIEEIIENY